MNVSSICRHMCMKLLPCTCYIVSLVWNSDPYSFAGRTIMAADPEHNMEKIVKFRDNPLTKSLAK